MDPELLPARVGEAVAQELGLSGQMLLGRDFAGDVYLSPSIDNSQRPAVLDAVRRRYSSHRQVAKVFTRNELLAAESPSGPPRQYYRVTKQGRARLEVIEREWNAMTDAVNRFGRTGGHQ